MTVKFLDLYSQYLNLKPEIDAAISGVIKDAAFIGGPHVKKFEADFSRYQNSKFCLGVANGTDALEIALQALDLPKNSEVLVPANTFIASSESVTRSGHRVVFCDCDPDTYTISCADAERRITKNTRAILAVHLYGHPCDMESVLGLANRYGLKVIEDCAQAHGAECNGRRVGAIGTIGTFSFYPGKNLGAYGDAGAITSNDEALIRKCRMIANHGRVEKYNHEFEGRNSRMDGIQAAILDVKLNHLPAWIKRRKEVAKFYRDALSGVGDLVLPSEAPWAWHVWHLFVVRTGKRDLLAKHLSQKNIETGIHYPIALPKLEAYRYLGPANCPVACEIDSQILSLPMGEHISNPEYIVDAVRSFFA